jgi:Domain of unknown function (DUF4377)
MHKFLPLFVSLGLMACGSTQVMEQTYEVASETVKCHLSFDGWRVATDLNATEICVQLREPGLTDYRPNKVQKFNFEPGSTYKIRVRSTLIVDGMADRQPTLELIEVLEKKSATN